MELDSEIINDSNKQLSTISLSLSFNSAFIFWLQLLVLLMDF